MAEKSSAERWCNCPCRNRWWLAARFVWSTVLTVGLFVLKHLMGWS